MLREVDEFSLLVQPGYHFRNFLVEAQGHQKIASNRYRFLLPLKEVRKEYLDQCLHSDGNSKVHAGQTETVSE